MLKCYRQSAGLGSAGLSVLSCAAGSVGSPGADRAGQRWIWSGLWHRGREDNRSGGPDARPKQRGRQGRLHSADWVGCVMSY